MAASRGKASCPSACAAFGKRKCSPGSSRFHAAPRGMAQGSGHQQQCECQPRGPSAPAQLLGLGLQGRLQPQGSASLTHRSWAAGAR